MISELKQIQQEKIKSPDKSKVDKTSYIYFTINWLHSCKIDICKDIFGMWTRYLRDMKDVFKELKVLGRKRKSCTSQINKDILETIFTSTSTFSSTILITFSRDVT